MSRGASSSDRDGFVDDEPIAPGHPSFRRRGAFDRLEEQLRSSRHVDQ